MGDRQAYIRRELLVSAIIAAFASGGAYVLMFGLREPARVWGSGGYAIDGCIQAFAVGLMASLAPGLLCRRALVAGRIEGRSGRLPRDGTIVASAFMAAVLFAITFGGTSALLLWAGGWQALPPLPAIATRVVAGVAMAVLATRKILHRLLH